MLQAQVNTSQPTKVYRKNKKGTIELIEANRDEYSVVPQGYYRLRLVGISEPFELVSTRFPDSTPTKLRMEWQVVASHTPAGRGSVGAKFSGMVNFTIGPKSNLGLIIVALTGEELELGANLELTDYIGLELEGTVTQATKPDNSGIMQTYTNLSYDTLVAISDEEEEESPPPPKKKGVAKAVEANPFNEDDEEA